jgi:Na+/melibiose symporter-like transporter
MFFYLKNIVKTSAAPTALLVGQISDGIATPIVGYFSDRTKTKYGNFCIL